MEIAFGPYRLKRQERRIEGPSGPVELSARAFDILCLLLDKPGEVVSKEAIFAAVWPGVVVEENTLQVHISALRKALDPNMIATVHGRGYKYAGPAPELALREASAERLDSRPVIAVLPFENLSGDPAQQYFSDGMTQDIVDRLVRFRVLSVVGIDSAFMARIAKPDIEAMWTSLGTTFLVSGNVRRSGSRIRISARLADASTRQAVWAEHYDRPVADLFEIQDEVAEMVAAKVAGQLSAEITGRSRRRHPASLTSYELTQLGGWHYNKLTRADVEKAIDCCERALAIDPVNAEALLWLGSAKCLRYFTDFHHGDLLQSVGILARSIEQDPANARSYVGYSYYTLWAEGIDAAKSAIDRALQINPGEPYANAQRALVAVYDGQYSAASEWLHRSLNLTPNPLPWFTENVALIAFQEERYRDAIPGFAAISDFAWDMMYLIACYGHLGERDKARAIVERFAAEGRVFDYFAAAAREPYRESIDRERLMAGLKLALAVGP